MRWTRRDWILLLLITLLGAALRFYQLGAVPPGFQFDEAFNAIDARQVLEGNRPLFLPANGGREVLYTYFQAGLVTIFGDTVYTYRLASALWGTLAVAATYLLLRGILRRADGRKVAAFTALALAISYWHIHFSHYGIRVITMPVIFSALFGVYWAATHARSAGRAIALYALAGAIAGLSVYSNPTGRFAPFVLIVYTAVVLWRNPEKRRLSAGSPVAGLLISGIVALLVFLPLGMVFYENPEFFLGHASEVSVFADRVSGATGPWRLLATNVLHVLGMFSFYGDREWAHGIAGRPLLDWAIAVPFYVGVVIWALRLFGRGRRDDPDGDALWLLALWAGVMLAPSVLSEAAPNYSRTLPALPAVLLPIGLGLAWLVTALARRWPQRPWAGYALAGALLGVSLVVTFVDYFDRFPKMTQVYYSYDVDKLDALAILRERARDSTVYLSPLWADHAPVRYFRRGSGIKTLDTADTVVLPANRSAVYAFTGEEVARAERFGLLWQQPVEIVRDPYGKPLLGLITLDAETASGWPPGYAPQVAMEAHFDDAPTLLGIQPSTAGTVNLFWRADATTLRNLTSFLHLIDPDGKRVGQADKLPGNGSYTTPSWTVGDRVLDRTYPEITDLCAGGDTVRAVVGWYEYAAANARRARTDAAGDTAVAGVVPLPVRPLSDEQLGETPPAQIVNEGAGDLLVIGYTLWGAESLEPGSPFVLDLYARAGEAVADLPVRFGDLGDGVLAPESVLEAGDAFCQRFRLRMPATMPQTPPQVLPAEATHPLTLTVVLADGGEQSVRMGDLTVQTSTRLYAQPAVDQRLDAVFGGSIRLAGATIGRPEAGALPVTLVWQATGEPGTNALAFVQLLAPDGSLVEQSGGVPGLKPTRAWIEGEYLSSDYALPVRADLAPGEYRVITGLYDELSLERLPAASASGERLPDDVVVLGSVLLPAP